MSKGKIIGYDISDAACQISFYNEELQEPQTYEASPESFQIPLVIATKNEQWDIGIGAKRMEILHEAKLVGDLLTKSSNREKIALEDTSYEAVWLLSKFVNMSLSPFENIEAIVFTVPHMNEIIAKILKGVALHMGVESHKIYIQDYRESFCNYMFYQPKELWQYDAALFYCDKSTVKSSMLKKIESDSNYNNKTFVKVEDVASVDQTVMDTIYPLLHGEKAREADARFKIFVENIFEQKVVSSVFLTGEGFENNWYPESLKVLCNGRRGFLGNNLYSKGACYTAMKRLVKENQDMVYIDQDKLTHRMGLSVSENGVEQYLPIVSWGSHWYETKDSWELLLENTEDIEIKLESLYHGQLKTIPLSLDALEERDSYSVKIELSVIPMDQDNFKIVVKDIGFGEFYPSSGFYLEEIIQLGGTYGKHHIV